VTETQTVAGAILTGLTLIAGALRWSVGRLAKSQDRSITALIENAKSHATLTVKFDALMSRFEGLAARFDGIVDTLLRDSRLDDSQKARLQAKASKTTRPTPRVRPDTESD
jgi:hypothetical protein